MEEKGRRKKKIWLALAAFLLAVAVLAGGVYIMDRAKQKKAQEGLAQLSEEQKKAEAETEPVSGQEGAQNALEAKRRHMKEAYGIDVPEKSPDFKELRATVCQDIYAWIYIPNTVIDYPVVQHPTDPSYYLEYNLDGSKGRPGGIFTQNYNKTDFSDRMTVIYGHNMGDGTMFADLHKYEKTDFFEANPYVFIYTEDDLFVYRIFAAHDYTDDHLLFQFDWTVDRVFLDYLGGILGDKDLSGNVDRGAEFDAESRILTLSTCIKGANEKRYLVQGVLLK